MSWIAAFKESAHHTHNAQASKTSRNSPGFCPEAGSLTPPPTPHTPDDCDCPTIRPPRLPPPDPASPLHPPPSAPPPSANLCLWPGARMFCILLVKPPISAYGQVRGCSAFCWSGRQSLLLAKCDDVLLHSAGQAATRLSIVGQAAKICFWPSARMFCTMLAGQAAVF
jgi:hypothetical protein